MSTKLVSAFVGIVALVYFHEGTQVQARVPGSICTLPKQIGPCRMAVPRIYYDTTTNKCRAFTWGGCMPNQNNFETIEECNDACGAPTCGKEGATCSGIIPTHCCEGLTCQPCEGLTCTALAACQPKEATEVTSTPYNWAIRKNSELDSRLEEVKKHLLRKEFVNPNGDLKVGHDIAEWDFAPDPWEVRQNTDGNTYEERSGTLLTDDLQVARYVPNPVETIAKQINSNKNFQLPEVVKGKIVAGDPVELNVIIPPSWMDWQG